MTTVPPPEITAKYNELKKRVDDGLASIAKLQMEVQKDKDSMKAIEHTIATVYSDDQALSAPMQDAVKKVVSDAMTKRRKISADEYKKMVLDFMSDKDTARSYEIKAYISKTVGFDVTDDMVSIAMDRLVKDERVPLIKLQRGLFKNEVASSFQV